MLDRIVEFSQALWVLAFLFYAVDVARLIPSGRMLLRERGNGMFVPTLGAFPFEIAKKELYLAGLLLPWRAILVARWPDAQGSTAGPGAINSTLTPLRNSTLTPLRWISGINFGCLFVLAPVLTHAMGLGVALLVVVPIVYGANLVAGVFVVRGRARFDISRGTAASLVVDALLCAPYGVNWVKRIARLQPELQPDLATLKQYLSPADFDRLASVIALRRADANPKEE